MGLRSFISGLFSRRSKDDAYAKFANDYERLAESREQFKTTSERINDLGLVPAIRITGNLDKAAASAASRFDTKWVPPTRVVNTPSPNLLANLDVLPPAVPVKAQEPEWIAAPSHNDDIQRRFEKFHSENPHVFDKLADLAIMAKANGHKRLGIKALVERVRWYYTIETRGNEAFKINNDYTSRYARKLMKDIPALRGFFQLRELY